MLSAADFHREFGACPAVPDFYGRNLDALWDALTGLIERPFTLVWKDSALSRIGMGQDFQRIVDVMHKAELEAAENPDAERFVLDLR